MAIQFARTQYVSRSTGGNACRKAAYNERTIMKCERTGEIFYFEGKSDNVHHEILLPQGVDEKFKNSHTLWNEAERCERRINSQVAKEMVLALPDDQGITMEHRIDLARSFIQKNFVAQGLAAQIDIHSPHEGEKNWHAHVLLTTRRFKENGQELGEKSRDLNQTIRKGFVAEGWDVGEAWKNHQNAFFREKGINIMVNPIGIVAQEHIGPIRMRQHMSEALERAELLRVANEQAVRNPDQILQALTRKQSTFTIQELDRFLAKHGDVEDRDIIKNQVLNHPHLIALTESSLFTTKQVREEEAKLLRFSDKVDARCTQHLNHVMIPGALSEEQQAVVRHVINDSQGLAIVQGRAGTGKSYTMNAIRTIYQSANINVIGLSPTNQVAQDMTSSGFDTAMTVHSFLFRHNNGRLKIPSHTVLIVDEAAMIPTNALVELFAVAKEHRCKLALFGDDRQLGSVERGGMFPLLAEKFGVQELSEVRRQHGWQKEVSEQLACGNTEKAAHLLNQHGAITWADTKTHALESLVKAWSEDAKNNPDKSRLVLANKNVDVDTINKAIQEIRQASAKEGFVYPTARGPETFFVNDRVCFTKTNKKLGISNGAFGTILSLSEKECSVQLDQGQTVQFNPQVYGGLKLGYASTVYKSQGKSIDQVYVLHDRSSNQKLSYVALTRQIQQLKIFVNHEQTPSLAHFAKQISRDASKLPSISLQQSDERQSLWQIVKETAKNFWVDHFHHNKAFYQIQNNRSQIEQTYNPDQALERNLKYCHFIQFSQENGRMPSLQDLPRVQDMVIRLTALEAQIYRETLLDKELKSHQHIIHQARQEMKVGKNPDPALMKEIQAKAEPHIALVKKEMESQIQRQSQREVMMER